MGLTYYISVQSFLFLYLIAQTRIQSYVENITLFGVLFLLMVVPAFFFSGSDPLDLFLANFRQYLCFIVLLVVMKNDSIQIENPIRALQYSNLVLLFLFSIILLQSIFLINGELLIPPIDLFVFNSETLIGVKDAAASGYFEGIRPPGLFGEPSYLGFVCISLLVICYSRFSFDLMTNLAFIFFIAILSMSQSLSAFISFLILSLIYFSKISNVNLKNISFILFISISVIGLYFIYFDNDSGNGIFQRLTGLFSKDSDSSTEIRMISPLLIIDTVLNNYVLGVPSKALASTFGFALTNGAVEGTDNGLFNLIINFGYTGFFVLGLLIYHSRKNALILSYILLSSFFNGAFLSIDKIAIIGFVIIITKNLKKLDHHISNRTLARL